MNKETRSTYHLLAATFIATALYANLSDLAYAADLPAPPTKSSHFFSWNWTIGDNVQFGTNRTKGSGVVKDESRAVTGFSRVLLALPAKVTISQGPAESLTITTDDNLLPLMTTRVDNGELIIEGDKNRGFSTRKGVNIRLTVKSVSAIKIQGSGDVIGDQLKSDKLDIAIAGSGDVKFTGIRADQFAVEIKGSGDVSIDSIVAKSVSASIHGSGDIRMPSLQAGQVTIAINGSGDVSAGGQADKVAIEVMGSGDVRAKRLIARRSQRHYHGIRGHRSECAGETRRQCERFGRHPLLGFAFQRLTYGAGFGVDRGEIGDSGERRRTSFNFEVLCQIQPGDERRIRDSYVAPDERQENC